MYFLKITSYHPSHEMDLAFEDMHGQFWEYIEDVASFFLIFEVLQGFYNEKVHFSLLLRVCVCLIMLAAFT
jgi:hypothetical protein